MEPYLVLTSGLCFLVGLSLGLFGGGGSVFAVPIFIYVAHYGVGDAIALSLVTTGAASLMASIRYFFRGFVNGRLVLIFLLTGLGTSFLGARMTGYVSEPILLLLFGCLMSVIAILLYLKSGRIDREDSVLICHPSLPVSTLMGAGTGFLTGFLGVGGGFLIVPAIALLMRCSLQTAIGTSLVIIAMNSAVGYWGHLTMKPMEIMPAALFVLWTVLGSFVGSRLGVELRGSLLQRSFAGLIFLLGLFLITRYFF